MALVSTSLVLASISFAFVAASLASEWDWASLPLLLSLATFGLDHQLGWILSKPREGGRAEGRVA